MTPRNHYHLLGVDRSASRQEIRSAYARLLKRCHPDADGASVPMSRRLHDLQAAYRCLSHPEQRAEHDRMLAEHERLHLARQRRLLRRLGRYDRRERRRPATRARPRIAWPPLLIAVGVAITVRYAAELFG